MKRDTRQDILNTAQALFREKGYNAVSVGGDCRRPGHQQRQPYLLF